MTFKVKDHYFKKAKKENFLARSIYKLEEIDKRYKILKKGDIVLDLGYYPGSWMQYTSQKVENNGRVIGVDIQPINKKLDTLKNIVLFQEDIFSIELSKISPTNEPFDVILSDMAPSTTGIKSVDQAKSLELVECVFEVAGKVLKFGGNLVVKVFESDDAQKFLKEMKKKFETSHNLKPKSTRTISKEFFFIGINYKG